jgi:hypothetical protein
MPASETIAPSLRLKLKIGEHEFEADGPCAIVEAQIETFARLIGREDAIVAGRSLSAENKRATALKPIHSVARVEGKLVRLSVQCPSASNAVLALLLGHRELRGVHAVSGTELMRALRASGQKVPRVDQLLQRFAKSGNVVMTGKHRARRYRLTTDGVINATTIVKSLAEPVARK